MILKNVPQLYWMKKNPLGPPVDAAHKEAELLMVSRMYMLL